MLGKMLKGIMKLIRENQESEQNYQRHCEGIAMQQALQNQQRDFRERYERTGFEVSAAVEMVHGEIKTIKPKPHELWLEKYQPDGLCYWYKLRRNSSNKLPADYAPEYVSPSEATAILQRALDSLAKSQRSIMSGFKLFVEVTETRKYPQHYLLRITWRVEK